MQKGTILELSQGKGHGVVIYTVHACAESGGVRPFGVSLLMAGYDDNGPQLYQIDPSGSYFAWKASAIGKNMTNAKTFLEKRYSEVGAMRMGSFMLNCHVFCHKGCIRGGLYAGVHLKLILMKECDGLLCRVK